MHQLVGIIDRAVAEKAVSHGLEDVTVEEYMDMDFETLTTDDTLFQAVGTPCAPPLNCRGEKVQPCAFFSHTQSPRRAYDGQGATPHSDPGSC